MTKSKGHSTRDVIGALLIILGFAVILTAILYGLSMDAEKREAEKRARLIEDKSSDLLKLFKAVCTVESENDPLAYNVKEKAAGIAQITPICVVDCNRIVQSKRWNLDDRYDPSRSFEMFKVYTTHYMAYYNLSGPEAAARIWCGGPTGWREESTKPYWEKVKRELEDAR